MKWPVVLLFSVLFLMTLGHQVAHANSSDKVKEETSQAVQAIKEFTFEKKQDFEQSIRKELQDLDKKMLGLQAKANEESKKQIEQLKVQRAELVGKLGEVAESTQSAWTEIRDGIGSALSELKTAFQRAKDKMGK